MNQFCSSENWNVSATIAATLVEEIVFYVVAKVLKHSKKES